MGLWISCEGCAKITLKRAFLVMLVARIPISDLLEGMTITDRASIIYQT